MNFKLLVIIVVFFGFYSEGLTWARTNDMKQVCVNCHTMHNSQNGIVAGGPGVLQGALLNNSCYGCHSDAISHVDTPVVLHTNSPSYMSTGTESGHNTLAGGDFYWVANGGDLKGHNVDGFATQTSRTPPGGSKFFDTSNPLTCAGINGCHGDLGRDGEISAMYQTHHAVEQSIDGSTVARSFRFINGVVGFEDSDYELTVGSADHNQYKGIARSADTDAAASISHSCAGCHGFFHFGSGNLGIWDGSGVFGDPWIRHPVDYEMGGLGGEYIGYGSGGNYNVATPLGSLNVSSAKSTVNLATASGDAIVICVSCHRAHGSPYDYSLRWNYKSWPDPGGYNGCGDCHTAKN